MENCVIDYQVHTYFAYDDTSSCRVKLLMFLGFEIETENVFMYVNCLSALNHFVLFLFSDAIRSLDKSECLSV